MPMTKDLEKDPTIQFCRVLDGPDRSELIESVLEDYTFCLTMGLSPKILKHHRELFCKLIKDFGH
mgnify:FL=1|jgi:hypothetical protein|tara:strand:- start:340 stop:534 length:195 start_codon:yes stop_codon:yes gene_type:complete